MRIGFAFGLAWRLARTRDPQHRWRQIVLPLGALVATFVVLCGFSAVAAAGRADARQEARRPVAVAGAAAGLTTALRGPIWHGRQIPVLWIEPSAGSTTVPPGLARLPRPGTIAISPGLRRDAFPADPIGFTIDPAGTGPDGTIGRAGLTSSTEYLIYARPPRGRTLGAGGVLMTIVGFGDQAPPGQSFALQFETVQPHPPVPRELVTSGFLYVLPALALAITTARAMSPRLARRSRSLRRLGVRLGAVRLIVALETTILGLPGMMLALALHAVASRRLDGIPGAGVRYWPGDLALPTGVAAAAALGILVAQTVAALPGRDAGARPLKRDSGFPAMAVATTLSPAVLGLGVVLVILGRTLTSVRVLILGLLLAVLGLGSGVRQLTSGAAKALRRSTRAATWLASARLRHRPLGLSRPATLVGILVLVALAWTGVQARALHATLEQTTESAGFTLSWRGPVDADLGRLRARLPGEAVWPMDSENRVLVPDCTAARELAAVTCPAGTPTERDAEALRQRIGYEVVVGRQADRLVVSEGSTLVFVAGRSSTPAQVEGVANAFLGGVNLTSSLALGPPQQLRWIIPGGVAAALVVLLSFLLAFGNRLLSLVGIDLGLLRAGLSHTDIRGVQQIETFVPMLVAALVGGLVGVAFLWAGTGLELTRNVWLIGIIEVLGVLLLASAVSGVVLRLQRTWLTGTHRDRAGGG